MKIHKPKSGLLSHLSKPKRNFGDDLPVNPGGINLPMIDTKTGSGGNKMSSLPSPSKSRKMGSSRSAKRMPISNKGVKGT